MRKLVVFGLGVLLSTSLAAQRIPGFERILLPIFAEDTPDVAGSLWVSELWVHNANDSPAQIGPVFVSDYLGVPPGATVRPPVWQTAVGYPPGLFISVRDTHAPRLHFNLRVRDVSRQTQNWGTEIPVIREADLRTDRINLVNVPLREGFRQMLRIYQLLNLGEAPGQFRVRFFPVREIESPGVLPFREEELTLAKYQDLAYAELANFGALSGVSAARIEIEPVTLGARYWAFVTVINNETQHLTTVTPQMGRLVTPRGLCCRPSLTRSARPGSIRAD